jgi:hypothetical protein
MVATHERLSADESVQMGSNRSFGIVFAVVFAIIGFVPLAHGGDIRLWALGCSFVFAVLALIWPPVLTPLNRIWFRIGLLLHKIINPVILGLMFFVIITPLAIGIRLFGAKLLPLAYDKSLPSYWHRRSPPGPEPESIRNQF